jgi:hypothetical protein
VQLPWAIGVALVDAGIFSHESQILALIGSGESTDVQLALAYVARRFMQAGWPWVEGLLAQDSGLSALQRGRVLVQTNDHPRAWEVADARGAEVADAFWRYFRVNGLGADFGHVSYAAKRLLSVGRAAGTLDLISIYLDRGFSDDASVAELVAAGLEAILAAGAADPEMRALSQHDLQRFFSYLHRNQATVGWERVARLEWTFLPVLGLDAQTETLHQLVADDPSFFVQIVTTVYRPHSGGETAEESPERGQLASNGYRLLSNWTRVPGATSDDIVDGAALRRWVAEARRLLEEADRLETGETHIGQVLAASPPDPDGRWPGIEVRNLIEELQSEKVEQGISLAIMNRRGFTVHAPDEGGKQEWELAEKFRRQADQFADGWPRTAAALRNVATHYEYLARRQDASAERFRRGLER